MSVFRDRRLTRSSAPVMDINLIPVEMSVFRDRRLTQSYTSGSSLSSYVEMSVFRDRRQINITYCDVFLYDSAMLCKPSAVLRGSGYSYGTC